MVTIGINWIVIAQLTLQKLPMIHLRALHISRIVGGTTDCCCWFSSWNIRIPTSPIEHVWYPIKWTHGPCQIRKGIDSRTYSFFVFLEWSLLISMIKKKTWHVIHSIRIFTSGTNPCAEPKKNKESQSTTHLVKSTTQGIDSNHGAKS